MGTYTCMCAQRGYRRTKIPSYRTPHWQIHMPLGCFWALCSRSFFFSIHVPEKHVWTHMPICVHWSALVIGKRARGCISMIKKTVTNGCCLTEAMWLSQQDIGQVYRHAHAHTHVLEWFDFTPNEEMDWWEHKKSKEAEKTQHYHLTSVFFKNFLPDSTFLLWSILGKLGCDISVCRCIKS